MKKNKFVKLFLGLILSSSVIYSCGSGVGGGTTPSASGTPFYSGVDSYLNFTGEDLKKSLDILDKNIEKDPTDAKSLALRAEAIMLFTGLGTSSSAFSSGTGASIVEIMSKYSASLEKDLDKAFSLKPELLEVNRARAYYKLFNLKEDEGLKNLDKALELNPNDNLSLFLNWIHRDKKSLESTSLKKLIDSGTPFIPAKINVAGEYLIKLKKGDSIFFEALSENDKINLNKAMALIKDSIKASPKNVTLRTSLSGLYAAQGNFDASFSELKPLCDDLKDEIYCKILTQIEDYNKEVEKITSKEALKSKCVSDFASSDKKSLVIYSKTCKPYVDEVISAKKTSTSSSSTVSSSPSFGNTPIQRPSYDDDF